MEKFHPDAKAITPLQKHPTPSVCERFFAFFQISAHGHKSGRFMAGTALIAGSFLVYLAYPIILLVLPFSGRIKLAAGIAVWLLSWGVFSTGIFLAGPEGFQWFKGLWSRASARHMREKQDLKQKSNHVTSVDSVGP